MSARITPEEYRALLATPQPSQKPARPRKQKTNKEQVHHQQLVASGMESVLAAMHVLMSRSKVPWRCEVKPEEKLCIDFADAMRKATLEGHYRGIWGHIPNEGKRHALVGIILRAMGLIKGSTDYFFMWDGGHLVMEAKIPGGEIRFTQKLYRAWCGYANIPHAYFRSVEDGIGILRERGALCS